MGLIHAIAGAAGGVLADSWRDFFYCDALNENVLAVKGQKRTSDQGRSSNIRGESNIISDGSIIAVNEGQCMIIVESGEIVDVCAEPGQFVYDRSTEPSIFYGDLGEGIRATFERIGQRFTFGGDTGKDQRIYFFNTKEIIGNKYGTSSPIPFRIVDANLGLDMDTTVRMNGEYSFRLVDPLIFYKKVCGNVEEPYTRDRLESQMKSELLTALQPALARISELGVRYSAIPAHTKELAAHRSTSDGSDDGRPEPGRCRHGKRCSRRHARRCQQRGRCHDRLHGHGHGPGHGRRRCSPDVPAGRWPAGRLPATAEQLPDGRGRRIRRSALPAAAASTAARASAAARSRCCSCSRCRRLDLPAVRLRTRRQLLQPVRYRKTHPRAGARGSRNVVLHELRRREQRQLLRSVR